MNAKEIVLKKSNSDAAVIADALWWLETIRTPEWFPAASDCEKVARVTADLRALLSRMMADGGKERGEGTP